MVILQLWLFTYLISNFSYSLPIKEEDTFKQDADRIVNGTEATKHAYPFMARLIIRWGEESGMCGGTLISENFVMTAAHCVFHPTKGNIIDSVTIYFGEHDRYAEDDDARAVRSGLQVFLHSYNKKAHYNDVALIQLSESLQVSANIKPACITDESFTGKEVNATAIGWGALGSGAELSQVLREVDIPVLDDSMCEKSYKTHFYPEYMMCAGYLNGTKDTCQGDSGGPLFIRENDQFTVIGMTSFGLGCASEGYPGIYTRISAYSSWVKSLLESNNDKLCIS